MIKHPSDRAERLRIKRIKEIDKEIKPGRVRRFRTTEEGLDHEHREFTIREETRKEPVA